MMSKEQAPTSLKERVISLETRLKALYEERALSLPGQDAKRPSSALTPDRSLADAQAAIESLEAQVATLLEEKMDLEARLSAQKTKPHPLTQRARQMMAPLIERALSMS